jgi:hypothetical protein
MRRSTTAIIPMLVLLLGGPVRAQPYTAPGASRSSGYMWREERGGSDWRNNSWREQRFDQNWRNKSWREQRQDEDWRQREELLRQRAPNNAVERGFSSGAKAPKNGDDGAVGCASGIGSPGPCPSIPNAGSPLNHP